MAPDNRIGGHYSRRFGWIVWFLVLSMLAYKGDASDVSQDEEGAGSRLTTRQHHSEKEDYADKEGERIHLTYSATTGTDVFRMLKPAGATSRDFLSSHMLKEIQNLERVNSQEGKKAWPIIVFENGNIVCSCLAIYDTNANTLEYDRLLMHPETVDKARALERLVVAMAKPPPSCRAQIVTVNTSPKNGLLIDALAKTGFSLKRYRKGSTEGGMGIYQWSMDMPFEGSYHEHRERQLLLMAEQVYALREKVRTPRFAEYVSDLEAEAFDGVQVKMVSTLSSVEALRASQVVLEKAKDRRDGGGILSAKYPRSFGFAAVGRQLGAVQGVLNAHITQEGVCMIDFLGASGVVEDYITLRTVEEQNLKEVVLKAVPVEDAGTVGLAAELGFVIKASSKDSLMMVRDASIPAPVIDYAALPRLYSAQKQVLQAIANRQRQWTIKGDNLFPAELAGLLTDEMPWFIKKKTQSLLLHTGAVVLAFVLFVIARSMHQARERERKRQLRYVHIPVDSLQEGDGESAVAVAGEDGAELAAANPSTVKV